MEYLDNMNYETLEDTLIKEGFQKFRAMQVFEFLHVHNVTCFNEISVLSKDARASLNDKFKITNLKILKVFKSKDGVTKKYLIELIDGEIVEAVLMKYEERVSICISSQVGCNMGCVFCASTKGGKARNLMASEMLKQIYMIEEENNKRIDNIVVMGQGEPLDNFSNLVKFLEIIGDERGRNKSYRKITVSTCGLPGKIRALARDYDFPITLALSLHRTTDDERCKIMPINKVYNLEAVMSALEYYYKKTNRRITFEYMVIGGENDTKDDAHRLKNMARRISAHVNLMELNPIEEYSNKGIENRAKEFTDYLNKIGVNATLRKSKGVDIEGACGQLRRKYKEGLCE